MAFEKNDDTANQLGHSHHRAGHQQFLLSTNIGGLENIYAQSDIAMFVIWSKKLSRMAFYKYWPNARQSQLLLRPNVSAP